MDWQDEGLILGVRRHGETSAIVEIMTPGHGRHLGLVRGGRSSKMRPILQPGNSVQANWHARLEEHLGAFTLEAREMRAARLMESPIAIYGIQMLASHLRLLPERDPHENLYRAACVLTDTFNHPDVAASLMVRFELALLDELGFGLDLSCCAVSAQTHDLAYVSPKSGRAVSRKEGEPWADRLLPFPAFLNRHELEWGAVPEMEKVVEGFRLSGYFLQRHIYDARAINAPPERAGFIRAIENWNKTSETGEPS